MLLISKAVEVKRPRRCERDPHNSAFINAALASTALTNRLAGLDNYHSRPEEEIVSNVATNPLGDLAIVGSGERALGAIDAGEARIRVSGNECSPRGHYCR